MNQQMENFDAVIMGGGLAGLAAAIYLRKKGKDVALIEVRKLALSTISIT
jgi:phytoene dehydrogenase-like protein